MSSNVFELAMPSDNQGIRELLSRVHMDGNIKLVFTREPDYFEALRIEGIMSQAVIYRDPKDRTRIVGLATRTIKKLYLNHQPVEFGYLSNLRIDPEFRNGIVLGRGYRFIRQLHFRDNRVPAYLTTITRENSAAMAALTRQRAGIPLYLPVGEFHTFSISSRSRMKQRAGMSTVISQAGNQEEQALLEFINREGSKRQFFPVLDHESLHGGLPGLSVGSFYIARKEGRITGVAAAWDQSGFKQTVVKGYKPLLQAIRPCYNLFSGIFSYPSLPSPGSILNSFYVSFCVVEDRDPQILQDILMHIFREKKGKGYDYMIIGFDSRDPLSKAVRGFRSILYRTSVYLVFFENHQEFIQNHALDDLYLEAATL